MTKIPSFQNIQIRDGLFNRQTVPVVGPTKGSKMSRKTMRRFYKRSRDKGSITPKHDAIVDSSPIIESVAEMIPPQPIPDSNSWNMKIYNIYH